VAGVATNQTLGTSGSPPAFPGSIGTFGAGDIAGVYGHSRPGVDFNQAATTLPQPPLGTGVYGVGNSVGVQGDCDPQEHKNGQTLVVTPGTGVKGTSVLGIGVSGISFILPLTSPVRPLPNIGVYGQSTVKPQPSPTNHGTGVFGIGDAAGVLGTSNLGRGGVFSTGSSPPGAQVQLVPVTVPNANVVTSPLPPALPPQLPVTGQAGDILVVNVPVANAPAPGQTTLQIWCCIQSRSQNSPAIWAQIPFSHTIPGTGPGAA
jgi:hypothetical protein